MDIGDDDPGKLMAYTNPAISFINNSRVAARDPETIKQIVIKDPIAKPDDFLAFSPPTAVIPVVITDGMVTRAPGAPPSVVLKYSIKVARVSNVNDTFPLPDEYADMVALYIMIRLKKDNNTPMAEELTILDRDVQAFVKAKGG